MTNKKKVSFQSEPSDVTISIDGEECGTTPIDVLVMYRVLRYTPKSDGISEKLAIASDDLLPLANFTSVDTKTAFEDNIDDDFDFFMYFGHGYDNCIFDESGYCTVYPDSNLKDKIIVLTTCHAGKGYAKEAVRAYGAIASLGYGAPLMTQLSGDGFKDGFKECYLKAQKVLLDLDEVTESDFISAYESTKELYNTWGDYYNSIGESFCASIFYADGKNLLSYSIWDEMTSIDISVSPTPAEVWKDGVYIGTTPITDYSVMSGGNVFRYKAIGCYLSWLIRNVPKSGASYELNPVKKYNTTAIDYSSENVYLEHDAAIDINCDRPPGSFEINFFNYGDVSQTIKIWTDREWDVEYLNGKNLKPHLMNGTRCRIIINETFEPPTGDNVRVEYVTIYVKIGSNTYTFTIEIWIHGRHQDERSVAYSNARFSPFTSQYNRMSETEKNTRNIIIGTKIYTPTEIMEEIDKGTDIGIMLMEAMR
ncbi:MAG: hypothetical protein OCU18_08775 [Candidatus Syntrophoarchaeum sp.]|nr:hypothetical protein [Candidatus Syntrophoarchaeum sp.]